MEAYAVPDDENFRYIFPTGNERHSQKFVKTNKKYDTDENCTDVIKKIQRCIIFLSYIPVN